MTNETQEQGRESLIREQKLQEARDKLQNPRHYLAKALVYYRHEDYGRALYMCDMLVPCFAEGHPEKYALVEKKDRLRSKVVEGIVDDLIKENGALVKSNPCPELVQLSKHYRLYVELKKQFLGGQMSERWGPCLQGITLEEAIERDANYLFENIPRIKKWNSSEPITDYDIERFYRGLAYYESRDQMGEYKKTLKKLRSLLNKIKRIGKN